MIWNDLLAQEPAKQYLRAVLNGSRLAHGYLFKGPAGVGKRSAAFIFTQIALCQERPEPDLACGTCKSCRWFQARKGALIEHPDVVPVLKFIRKGDSVTEQFVGDQEPIIKLETVHYLCEQLHRAPLCGTRKVVIIPEAHRLCGGQAESANAFLKTLEEPPKAALIIMTSSRPEALLETIVSRMQAVQFKRLPAAAIEHGLAQRARDRSPEEVRMLAKLADGSLGRGFELLDGDLKKWRDAVVRGLGSFSAKNFLQFGSSLWQLAQDDGTRLFETAGESQREEIDEDDQKAIEAEEKSEAGWKRYVFRRLLELTEICFRDALIASSSAASEIQPLLVQADQAQMTSLLATKFGSEGCERSLRALREAMLANRLYVRGDVVARALAGRLCDALAAV